MSKRSEEAACEYAGLQNPPTDDCGVLTAADYYAFIDGYEQAEKDLGWHSVDECLPKMDEEVIVLVDRLNLGALFAIAFGHIVDKEKAVNYNGWNIPGVRFWMPCPKIPEEKR